MWVLWCIKRKYIPTPQTAPLFLYKPIKLATYSFAESGYLGGVHFCVRVPSPQKTMTIVRLRMGGCILIKWLFIWLCSFEGLGGWVSFQPNIVWKTVCKMDGPLAGFNSCSILFHCGRSCSELTPCLMKRHHRVSIRHMTTTVLVKSFAHLNRNFFLASLEEIGKLLQWWTLHSHKRIMKPFAFAKSQNFRVFTKEYS